MKLNATHTMFVLAVGHHHNQKSKDMIYTAFLTEKSRTITNSEVVTITC